MIDPLQGPAADKPKEEKDEVDESKFDEFMGNDAGRFCVQSGLTSEECFLPALTNSVCLTAGPLFFIEARPIIVGQV